MNERQLDEVLRGIRRSPTPPCPAGFEDGVLRRVRTERTESLAPNAWSEIMALALRPRMAAALIAFTASLGAVTTAVASQVAPPVEKRSDSLGLEVLGNPHLLECHHIDHRPRAGHARHR